MMAVLALSACASAPAPAPSYRMIDLSDDYVAVFDATRSATPAERVAAFQARITPLFPEFYARTRYPEMTQEAYDKRIAASFEAFAALRPAYEQASGSFVAALDPALKAFVHALPDMGPVGDIYLVHSLGEMDGGTREFDGRTYFIFGADVIARVHKPGSTQPFFHHELFHIYQQHASNVDCPQIWCAIWQEGVAVLAAAELNPGATDDQLLLTLPQPIRPAVDANLKEAVCEVRQRLDSANPTDYRPLFNFQRLNARLPARFGYYVGYLVAREARRTLTLQQLAHLDSARARAAVEAGLAALATCP
jgi:hypothetical protein